MRKTKLNGIISKYASNNLKSGGFKEAELTLYDTRMSDQEIILKYQEALPVLNDDNKATVNARDLHNQLGVGRDFSTWMKDKIKKYNYEEGLDYKLTFTKTGERKNVKMTDYSLTLSMAKDLAMVENNGIGNLTRKYFQAVERAFKNRTEWNYDRADTLISCKPLLQAITKYHKELIEFIPEWARSIHQAEFCMFNNIVIGMSATAYRNTFGLNKTHSIRNTLDEKKLEYIAELEKYDADLIMVQNIFDYNKRFEILAKKYALMD